MSRIQKLSRVDVATVAVMVLGAVQPAFAGTQGAYMNTQGFGKAVARIVYGGRTNTVTSPAAFSPCAAINPQAFTCSLTPAGALPPGTPYTVFCQSRGFPNLQWSIQSAVAGGATADDPDLEAKVNVIPAACASYNVESSATFPDANTALIKVDAIATAGTALWFRVREFTGEGTPADLNHLLANSQPKAEIILVGPFELTTANCNAIQIPVTSQTGVDNLYFIVDSVAKSLPFTINCPENLVFKCGEAVVYPPVTTSGGCGAVNVDYSPPANLLPPGLSTVTATATDEAGSTAVCTFQVNHQVPGFTGFAYPISGIGGSCIAPIRNIFRGTGIAPIRFILYGNVIPVRFATTCGDSALLSGSPSVTIQKCSTMAVVGGGNCQVVANAWQFNWDTTGLPGDTYKIVATLQDGSQRVAFVKLK